MSDEEERATVTMSDFDFKVVFGYYDRRCKALEREVEQLKYEIAKLRDDRKRTAPEASKYGSDAR